MPSNSRKCEDCKCMVAPQYFRNSSVCRMCVFKNRQHDQAREVRGLKDSLKELQDKYDVLLEFVTATVCTIPPSLGQNTSSASREGTYASRLVTPASQEVPLPASQALPQAPQSPRPASQAPRPASQKPRPASQAPQPASQPQGFQIVRNGARPKRKPLTPTTFVTSNRFQVLANAVEDESETRLVGDSMVRQQRVEFCGRSSNGRRKLFCYPGAGLDDITAVCDDVTSDSASSTLYVLHAGTNDVGSTRSEELLEKYRRMIKQFKSKTSGTKIVVSGILPRVRAGNDFYSKAFSTNNRLKTLCAVEDVNFVNFWNDFYFDHSLYRPDGVHLNAVGAARFGRLLCDEVSKIRSKNGTLTSPAVPP